MLTTKLILERLDREGRLLERRCQPARSFTKGFIEMLYIAHAEIQAASPYSMADIDMVPRDVDDQAYAVENRSYKHHLRIGASPGLSPTRCNPGHYSVELPYKADIQGCDLGIAVGVGTTAVTPTDRRLEQRNGHGRRPPDGAPAVFESYTAGDDNDCLAIYGADRWTTQPFMPAESHRITSVRVKIWKAAGDTPGNVTVVIQGSDSAVTSHPSGVTLASGTILEAAIPVDTPGDWVECTLATPVDLYAGHQYFIILQALTGDAANPVLWRYDDGDATYGRAAVTYAGTGYYPLFLTTINAGVSWTLSVTDALMFEEKGQSVGEFEIGGCELGNILFADPDGEFTIRRYFTNHCGQAITVNEAGMVAAGTHYHATDGLAWPFLIAHDIVTPGVAVANGELLRATYVPQITV